MTEPTELAKQNAEARLVLCHYDSRNARFQAEQDILDRPEETAGLLGMLYAMSKQASDFSVGAFNQLLTINTPESLTAAAMMLMPPKEDLEWELFAYDAARDPRFGRFQMRIKQLTYAEDPEELGPQWIGNGATPALALGAAIARSMEL